MKLLLLVLLFLMGCGDGNQITEVGNPVVASGTTTALRGANVGLFSTVGESVQGFFLNQTTPATCAFDPATLIVSCECEAGGTVTHVFTEGFSESGGTITFNHSFETTYNDCAFDSCSETVAIEGRVDQVMTGTADVMTGSADLRFEQRTTVACSGLTIGDADVGIDMVMTFDGVESDFSGTWCVDGTSVTFGSLIELQDLVDPTGICASFFP